MVSTSADAARAPPPGDAALARATPEFPARAEGELLASAAEGLPARAAEELSTRAAEELYASAPEEFTPRRKELAAAARAAGDREAARRDRRAAQAHPRRLGGQPARAGRAGGRRPAWPSLADGLRAARGGQGRCRGCAP